MSDAGGTLYVPALVYKKAVCEFVIHAWRGNLKKLIPRHYYLEGVFLSPQLGILRHRGVY